jgi:CubicO group peptidase (beta-lactamase class C family)
MRDRTVELFDARLAAEQGTRRVPSIAAGLVRDGELVWSGGRGHYDGRADGPAPDADVQYRCGSITKTFVAVAIMRLRDEGKLALEDPVSRFLPDTGATAQLTVAQLLTHSSGLRAESGEEWWERTPGGDLAQLTQTTLRDGTRFEAGRRFHYSNTGFGVLGGILAAVREKPWEQVIADDLLAPLQMRRTTPRPVAPAAQGFAVHPWADVLLPEPEHDAGAMAPAGQLWTTVADLARWAAFLHGDGEGLISADTLAEMREPRAVYDDRGEKWTGAHGLGLMVFNEDGRRFYGHGGSMPGFLAGLSIDAETGDAAVEFANATRGLSGELSVDLLAILAREEPRITEEWTPHALPDGVLEALGVWYWGVGPYVLAASGQRLELRAPMGRGRESRFDPAGGAGSDTWIGLDGYHTGEPLRIVRRPDGTVSHLDIGSFIYTREPYDPSAPVPGGVDPGGWRA